MLAYIFSYSYKYPYAPLAIFSLKMSQSEFKIRPHCRIFIAIKTLQAKINEYTHIDLCLCTYVRMYVRTRPTYPCHVYAQPTLTQAVT